MTTMNQIFIKNSLESSLKNEIQLTNALVDSIIDWCESTNPGPDEVLTEWCGYAAGHELIDGYRDALAYIKSC